MLHIKSLEEGLTLYKALASEIRIEIIKVLLKNDSMNMNELATASRYNIPIIQVVINNQVLGMVRQWQTLFYGKRYSQTVLKDKVDFCKVAEGLGCTAIRVTKKEEVAPAIEKAIALKAPVMIECMIPEDDKVFPMVPAGAPISEVFDGDDLKRQS